MAFKFDKISEPLIKVAGVVSQVKILMAIKNAFIRVIPFTLVASFANIIVSVIGSVEKYLNIKNAILDEITKGFGYVNSATIGIIALLVVVFVAYEYSLALKTEEKKQGAQPNYFDGGGSRFILRHRPNGCRLCNEKQDTWVQSRFLQLQWHVHRGHYLDDRGWTVCNVFSW